MSPFLEALEQLRLSKRRWILSRPQLLHEIVDPCLVSVADGGVPSVNQVELHADLVADTLGDAL